MTLSLIILYFADGQFSWAQYGKQIYLIHRMMIFCFSTTLLSVDCIKLFVGSPRPYFLEVHAEYEAGDVDEIEEIDARLSFPSGHAALGLSQCLLLSIMLFSSWRYTQTMYFERSYVVGMKSDNPHSYYLSGLWWILREIPLLSMGLIGTPTIIAIWNGLTRIRDYKHFAVDVVGGWVIGGSIAFVSYLIFYQETYIVFDYKLKNMIETREITENKQEHPNGSDEELKQMVQENA